MKTRKKPRIQGKRKALRRKNRALQDLAELQDLILKRRSELLRSGVYAPLNPEKAVPLSPTRGAASFRFRD